MAVPAITAPEFVTETGSTAAGSVGGGWRAPFGVTDAAATPVPRSVAPAGRWRMYIVAMTIPSASATAASPAAMESRARRDRNPLAGLRIATSGMLAVRVAPIRDADGQTAPGSLASTGSVSSNSSSPSSGLGRVSVSGVAWSTFEPVQRRAMCHFCLLIFLRGRPGCHERCRQRIDIAGM